MPTNPPPRLPPVVPPRPLKTLNTSALCQAAGVTRGMLRLYETEGVIAAPGRTPAGYRAYPADTVARLLAVRQLKEIGFTLREIALLLAEHDDGEIDAARLQELAREQLVAIDLRIARLEVVRGYVAQVAAGDAALINDPECSFLVAFLQAAATRKPARGVDRQMPLNVLE
jgi:MerR family transcriptional regulator, copper efflux regulator